MDCESEILLGADCKVKKTQTESKRESIDHVFDEYLRRMWMRRSWGCSLPNRVWRLFSCCQYNDLPRTWLMLLSIPLVETRITSHWWVTVTTVQINNPVPTTRREGVQFDEWKVLLFGCLVASHFVWTPFSRHLQGFSTGAAQSYLLHSFHIDANI